ncbi:hypothetical protein K440DRAFT_614263 [Wilcoxina mikolae CBS 423.85]|nr:hypothetical protein K440DRAFT_614263 [Wilcoxina mikolae CBS 423.85]
MQRNTWVSNRFLAKDAVQLGGLVLNAEHPEQDFFSLYPLSPADDSVATIQLETFHDILIQSEGSQFRTFLMKHLSMTFGITDHSVTVVDAAICQTSQLKNSGEFFRDLCKNEKARQWMERAIRRRKDIYLVVGIKTLTDPMVTHSQRRSTNNSADMKIPMRQVPSAIGLGFDFGGSRTNDFGQDSGCKGVGEQVYSVQYRKIRFEKFSSRDVDRTFLEHGNRWRLFVSRRGEEDGYDDILDLELDEGPERSDLDNDYESLVIGDDEVLFVLEQETKGAPGTGVEA